MAIPAAPFDYESAVEACARGERTALRALYEREAAWLLGVALRIVRNRDSARDVLQDAFEPAPTITTFGASAMLLH